MDNPATPAPAPPSPAPAPPAPAAPTPAAQTPPAAPPVVPLTVDEYQRLRGLEEQFKTFQTTQAQAMQEAENKRLKLLAEKEGAEKALGEQRTAWEQKLTEKSGELAKFQQQIFAERTERTFAEALAGRVFFGDDPEHLEIVRKQVMNELRSRFEATHDASGQIVVREKGTGMPAEHVLPKLLDGKEFAHFFKAKGTGGTLPGAAGPYSPAGAPQPGTLADVASQYKAAQGRYPGFGLVPLPSNQ